VLAARRGRGAADGPLVGAEPALHQAPGSRRGDVDARGDAGVVAGLNRRLERVQRGEQVLRVGALRERLPVERSTRPGRPTSTWTAVASPW
jgi:hypothetical protein